MNYDEQIKSIEELIGYFDYKINNVLNRTETEYRGGLRRLMLQRNKLIYSYHILLETRRRNVLGIKKQIKPHKFNEPINFDITFLTDYYF